MLSETSARQIFSETPEVPDFLLSKRAWGPTDTESQSGTAIHSAADDIAAYIVDAGFTHCEAVVTFASDESIMQPVGQNVLVPLCVLKLLSSRRPLYLPVYASIFQVDHLFSIKTFINFCIRKQLPAHRLFVSDEQPPWKAMAMICSELLYFMLPKPPSKKLKEGELLPKPKSGKPIRGRSPPILEFGETSSEDSESHYCGNSEVDTAFPQYFDHVRSDQVGYWRGREQMCVYLRKGHVS